MNKVFAFGERMVRVAGDNAPLFVLTDVCRALDIENTSQAAGGLPDDEKGLCQTYTLGGQQNTLVVTEAGLYRLIFRSDKPEAKRFQDWVFKEVLPEIRRTGRYAVGGDEVDRLWDAFHKARNWRVQMEILRALGLTSAPSALTASPLSPEQFWLDVYKLVMDGPGSRHVRLLPNARGRDLFLAPGEIITALQGLGSGYERFDRADFRSALQLTREWQDGKHRQRLDAESSGGLPGWLFSVLPDSPRGLVQIADHLTEELARSSTS